MVMHFKTCCCGCSLKTGSVIIGVLSGICGLIGLIVYIMGASVGTGELQKEMLDQIKKQNVFDIETYEKAKEIQESTKSSTLAIVFICLAIVSAIQLIVSIMLVFGASAERARLVKPWIVYSIMALVAQTILTLVSIITTFINGAAMAGVLGLVGLAVGIVLGVYFILIVNSFHTELTATNFQNKI